MSSNYGIKVSKTGADVNSGDIRDLLMSSEYSMLKYHSDNLGTVTLHPGDIEGTVDFTHSLGYTPAFIAYYQDLNGVQRFIPGIPRSVGYTNHGYAYSDALKVRCGIYFDIGAYNQIGAKVPGAANNFYGTTGAGGTGFCAVGNVITTSVSGALRFTSITLAQGTTITSATLNFAAEGRNGSSNILLKTYGIAEDNTADFSSNPMGRTKTSASTTQSISVSSGAFFGISVTSQVQEILNRAGWASNNAMGFLLTDNGTANNTFVVDDYGTGIESNLVIVYGNNTTLTFRAIIFKDKIA